MNSTKTLKTKKDSGFTLIEVLIAISIFSIGLLAVGLMQINALTVTNSGRRTTEAMALAEDQVEVLMSLPFYADDNGFDDDGADRDNDASTTFDDFDVMPDLEPRDDTNPHFRDAVGFYTVYWTVEDDFPIGPYDDGVFTAGVSLTRSKTIVVWVTPDNNVNDVQAELEFAKFYRMD